ncbi:uncharacterized protein LOC117793977 [Drosophila innubila]|uniref:uncharacterized protein LOC117793977 n=1 Tax=Drosophila innubila TaxID=198719 RepID=UPI00148DEDA1|nr:uncharacterized protein LOC117793977 [Drosophila innubila]
MTPRGVPSVCCTVLWGPIANENSMWMGLIRPTWQQLPLLWALLAVLPATRAVLSPSHRYDDENSSLQLSLEDLEREQEQQQYQHLDVNRPPLLPTHYDWHPSVAASVPPSYVRDAAQLEQAERLRQLHLQHQQLSAGYALPAHLPGGLLLLGGPNVSPTSATTTTTAATTTKSGTRLLQPIVPFDLDLQLQLNGVHYLNGNSLTGVSPSVVPRPLPRPGPRPLRPPYTFIQHPPLRSTHSAHPSLFLQQSKQFAYAPLPQRNYASAPRIPLPYPPSFISITTRRPGSGYAASYSKPFRPSQPDLTPDLFAGRESKSLLDSYIPSWEVLRLLQQHQQSRPLQRHTLAYSVPNLRLFKRDSSKERLERTAERSRIVKKSLPLDETAKLA